MSKQLIAVFREDRGGRGASNRVRASHIGFVRRVIAEKSIPNPFDQHGCVRPGKIRNRTIKTTRVNGDTYAASAHYFMKILGPEAEECEEVLIPSIILRRVDTEPHDLFQDETLKRF